MLAYITVIFIYKLGMDVVKKNVNKIILQKKLLHKLIRSNYRTSLEQEDIILEGHQTRGGPAMMLADINDDEDNDINRETWYQVKRGMEDRKLTSGPSQAFNQPCLLLHGHREPQGQMQGVDAGSTDSSI